MSDSVRVKVRGLSGWLRLVYQKATLRRIIEEAFEHQKIVILKTVIRGRL